MLLYMVCSTGVHSYLFRKEMNLRRPSEYIEHKRTITGLAQKFR